MDLLLSPLRRLWHYIRRRYFDHVFQPYIKKVAEVESKWEAPYPEDRSHQYRLGPLMDDLTKGVRVDYYISVELSGMQQSVRVPRRVYKELDLGDAVELYTQKGRYTGSFKAVSVVEDTSNTTGYHQASHTLPG